MRPFRVASGSAFAFDPAKVPCLLRQGPVLALVLGTATIWAPSPSLAAEAMAEVAGPATVALETIVVTLNQAKIIRLPANAQTVIVGNPAIADVTVQKNGILVVTGKSYGMTNVIALDAKGTVLGESQLRVDNANDAIVMVQRGLERQSYTCTPTCEPTVTLGDDAGYFESLRKQIEDRNGLAGGR
ncbi:pilus assembly protein N-terminal domain-containing protein [Chelatococcus sp. GCM10030263]|uniref:pilus assembly protein N-terminal domain-containing protein n=1 Tax=Chelatococcus sp. GCM10030263 TaxID=3273387 RepID=UPI003616C133